MVKALLLKRTLLESVDALRTSPTRSGYQAQTIRQITHLIQQGWSSEVSLSYSPLRIVLDSHDLPQSRSSSASVTSLPFPIPMMKV